MEEQTFNQNFNQQSANIISRVTGIITKPNEEWNRITSEAPDNKKVVLTYVLPLAVISGICAILGYALIGKTTDLGFLGSVTQKGWNYGIQAGLMSILSSVLSVFISAFVINALANSFKSTPDFGRAVQLVSYSFTPSWIGGLLAIIPSISPIGSLFGLYGLYLMYLGLTPLMKTPKENAVGYLIVSILVIIISYFIIGLILTPLLALFI